MPHQGSARYCCCSLTWLTACLFGWPSPSGPEHQAPPTHRRDDPEGQESTGRAARGVMMAAMFESPSPAVPLHNVLEYESRRHDDDDEAEQPATAATAALSHHAALQASTGGNTPTAPRSTPPSAESSHAAATSAAPASTTAPDAPAVAPEPCHAASTTAPAAGGETSSNVAAAGEANNAPERAPLLPDLVINVLAYLPFPSLVLARLPPSVLEQVCKLHTRLIIDASTHEGVEAWGRMLPQRARQLGQLAINVSTIMMRHPGFFPEWGLAALVAFVGGQAAGRAEAAAQEGSGIQGASLKAVSFEGVPLPVRPGPFRAPPVAPVPSAGARTRLEALTSISGLLQAHHPLADRWLMPSLIDVSGPGCDGEMTSAFLRLSTTITRIGSSSTPTEKAELLERLPLATREGDRLVAPLSHLETIGTLRVSRDAVQMRQEFDRLETVMLARNCPRSSIKVTIDFDIDAFEGVDGSFLPLLAAIQAFFRTFAAGPTISIANERFSFNLDVLIYLPASTSTFVRDSLVKLGNEATDVLWKLRAQHLHDAQDAHSLFREPSPAATDVSRRLTFPRAAKFCLEDANGFFPDPPLPEVMPAILNYLPLSIGADSSHLVIDSSAGCEVGRQLTGCMTGINELSVWKAVDVHFVHSILLAIGGGMAMEKVYFSVIRGSGGLWLGADIYPSIKDLNVCIESASDIPSLLEVRGLETVSFRAMRPDLMARAGLHQLRDHGRTYEGFTVAWHLNKVTLSKAAGRGGRGRGSGGWRGRGRGRGRGR
ncbi:unnamed protein product [Vitrella brassicaformis CCMP3155]|uniref:F-box domain-containing protein n=1 Tax=Vitrella brassicaformis (strain CCMP3155) TaxID=1169540 RepID=A0A0G4FQG0_VITBC|nr:unnamed protein product [Vitrella brassicaformis CCMP3155]|eukprot:CEM16673.1 unnamed protein product [Vitrella brassicaformis CCMP3155]